jgi:hypothetical protein
MKSADREYTSSFYGMSAILEKRLEGEWRIKEYDNATGFYCGSHTYNSEAEAVAWLAKSKFYPRHWAAAVN